METRQGACCCAGVAPCLPHSHHQSILAITPNLSFLQEEREQEERRLQEIMEENNKKILEAQRKLVSCYVRGWGGGGEGGVVKVYSMSVV